MTQFDKIYFLFPIVEKSATNMNNEAGKLGQIAVTSKQGMLLFSTLQEDWYQTKETGPIYGAKVNKLENTAGSCSDDSLPWNLKSLRVWI